MSRFGRAVAGVGGAVAIVLFGGVGPTYAGSTLQQCMNQAINHNGEPPTCTKVNGSWIPSWSDDPGASGIPGAFVFLVVVIILVSIGITIWKVNTAQKLAKQSGMDPGLATQLTLLSDEGLDATYVASSLRQRPVTPVADTSKPVSAAERLTELSSLLDQGLISTSEYDERRRAIIETL